MIGSLRGAVLERTTEGEVLLEVGGVGYLVTVSSRVLAELEPGTSVFLTTVTDSVSEAPERSATAEVATRDGEIIITPLFACVKPGDACLVNVDGGYSHEFTTAQVHYFLSQEYGSDYRVPNPAKFAVFEDHLLYATGVERIAAYPEPLDLRSLGY